MKLYSILTILLFSFSQVAFGHCSDCEGKITDKVCDCSEDQTSRAALLKGESRQVEYKVAGMSCEGCSAGLIKKLEALEGVVVDNVSHESGSANLTYSSGTEDTILKTIKDAGYVVQGEMVSLQVSGMDCSECEKALSAKAAKMEGVVSVEKVSHESGVVSLTVTPATCQTTLIKAIEEAGYKVTPKTP